MLHCPEQVIMHFCRIVCRILRRTTSFTVTVTAGLPKEQVLALLQIPPAVLAHAAGFRACLMVSTAV